jgi:hypothetical protein
MVVCSAINRSSPLLLICSTSLGCISVRGNHKATIKAGTHTAAPIQNTGLITDAIASLSTANVSAGTSVRKLGSSSTLGLAAKVRASASVTVPDADACPSDYANTKMRTAPMTATPKAPPIARENWLSDVATRKAASPIRTRRCRSGTLSDGRIDRKACPRPGPSQWRSVDRQKRPSCND